MNNIKLSYINKLKGNNSTNIGKIEIKINKIKMNSFNHNKLQLKKGKEDLEARKD